MIAVHGSNCLTSHCNIGILNKAITFTQQACSPILDDLRPITLSSNEENNLISPSSSTVGGKYPIYKFLLETICKHNSFGPSTSGPGKIASPSARSDGQCRTLLCQRFQGSTTQFNQDALKLVVHFRSWPVHGAIKYGMTSIATNLYTGDHS